MRRASFVVTDDGSTPERPLVSCLYCRAPVGEEHRSGCVMRRRTVVLRAIIEYVAEVPEDWDAEAIYFMRNEGSWCKSNLEDDLSNHLGGWENQRRCLCDCAEIEYVREATEHDEARSEVRVGNLTD